MAGDLICPDCGYGRGRPSCRVCDLRAADLRDRERLAKERRAARIVTDELVDLARRKREIIQRVAREHSALLVELAKR